MARDRERDARSAQGGRSEGESANLDAAAGTTGSATGSPTSSQGAGEEQGRGSQRSSFFSRASERASRRAGQQYGGFGTQRGYGEQGSYGAGSRGQGSAGRSEGYQGSTQSAYQGGYAQGSVGQGGYQGAGPYDYQGGGFQSGGAQSGGHRSGNYPPGGFQGAGSQEGGFRSGYQSGYQGSQQGGHAQGGYQGRSLGPEGREWREQGSGRSAGQAGGDISVSGRGEGFRRDERSGEWQSGAGRGESFGAQAGAGRSEFGSADVERGERDWPGDQYSRQVGGYQSAGGATAAGAAGFAAGYGAGYATRGYAGTERDASADLGLGYRDFGEGREAGRRTRWQREPTAARDVMTKNPKSVTPNASVREIAQIMRDESTGIVPVVEENGKLLGVVTDRDIVMRALAEGRNPLDLVATDVMTDDVEAVTPDESLREVVDLMGNKQIRRVPVVDQNDRLVGIISMADVATRADYDEDLQDALEEISARRSFWSRIFG